MSATNSNVTPMMAQYLSIKEGSLLCVDSNVFLDDGVDVSRKAKDAHIFLGNHIEHNTTRALAMFKTVWVDF